MKKELMYVAPEAEVLVAQVEKGFQGSVDRDEPQMPEIPF